jgi:hypothetical protein
MINKTNIKAAKASILAQIKELGGNGEILNRKGKAYLFVSMTSKGLVFTCLRSSNDVTKLVVDSLGIKNKRQDKQVSKLSIKAILGFVWSSSVVVTVIVGLSGLVSLMAIGSGAVLGGVVVFVGMVVLAGLCVVDMYKKTEFVRVV